MFSIMIVEDDKMIAKSLKAELEKWQQEVHIATNFNDITADFLAVRPQMVLLDVTLPAFNGYHWCQEIRKNLRSANYFYHLKNRGYGYDYGDSNGSG